MYLSTQREWKSASAEIRGKPNRTAAKSIASVRFISLINCNLLIRDGWHATYITTHGIVRYAKHSKSFQSNLIWLSRVRPYARAPNTPKMLLPAIVMLSSIFFQSSSVVLSFCRFSSGIFAFALAFAACNHNNCCQQDRKHEFFSIITRFLISAFSHNRKEHGSKNEHKWGRDNEQCCGDGGDTKQFSRICIRNWIKMQSYYSPFAINVNERHINRRAKEHCAKKRNKSKRMRKKWNLSNSLHANTDK